MIVRSNPSTDLDHASFASFDSDAPSPMQAIREIDAVAARHGLLRARESYPQRLFLTDGRAVFRGICYRPEPTGLAERVAVRRGTDVQGMSSAEIVREMRGQEWFMPAYVVVDASVTGAWLFPERFSINAQSVLTAIAARRVSAIAPDRFVEEVLRICQKKTHPLPMGAGVAPSDAWDRFLDVVM
jgi:hypothetical protein